MPTLPVTRITRRLFPAFFLLLPCCAPAQSGALDSLRHLMNAAPDWKSRIEYQYRFALKQHLTDSIQWYGHEILREAEQRNYALGIGYGERLLGDGYLYKGQNKEALPHYLRSDSALETAGNINERLLVLGNAGYSLHLQGRFGDAIAFYSKEVELSETAGDQNSVGSGLKSIGICLMRQQKFREAIPFLLRSLPLATKNKPEALTCMELGTAYERLDMPDSALYYFQRSLQAAEKNNQNLSKAEAQRMLGSFYLHKGEPTQAEPYLTAALEYFESRNSYFGASGLFKVLMDLELARHNYAKAIEWGEKAQLAMEKSHDKGLWERHIHANMYQAYAGLGRYQEALDHLLAWKNASDSLTLRDNARKIAEVEAQFQTREQGALIERQRHEIERQRGLLLIGLLSLLLIGAAAYIGRARAQAKKRAADYALHLHETESRKLRELDKVKSAFFANISHEFRTPLTLLIGPLRDMETGRFQGNAQKYYGIMRRNAERLLQLVNQLLDLSRLENGRLTLQPLPGNIHAALRAISGSFESLADRKQIHFDVFVPKAPLWVHFDHDKLEKIVANLLSNAFKFTPEEGSVGLRVEKLSEDDGSVQLVLSVIDTGIGIPADQLPHIFDRFYRVENNQSDAPEGSGIGLALARELALLHGGKIEVQSVENDGTTFTVMLPFALATAQVEAEPLPETPEPAPADKPEAPAAKPGAKEGIVLVVEDNDDLRTYIKTRLDDQYRILEAANGREALELAFRETPDLILTDLMMPEMDGMELTRQLKNDARTSHIPVIMLTAKAERDDRIEGLDTGAEAYLTKPFDAGELRALSHRLVEQRKVLQEKYSHQTKTGASLPAAPSIDDLFVKQVMEVIGENLDDDLFGVEQLAAAVNMSRSNLFRKLDALLGKSPTHLIRDTRLARAWQLLEQGAGNTTEVAMMTGFNTPAYFVKCFVDQYGITPGELRKRGVIPTKEG